jgi:hypothetical protein
MSNNAAPRFYPSSKSATKAIISDYEQYMKDLTTQLNIDASPKIDPSQKR